jgi:GNAT superfamily N-acetyltransferase
VSKRAATSVPGFVIRSAVKADVPLILRFIKELARYEKLAHQVTATGPLLRRTLFGKRRVAEVLIGCYRGKPAGFALFFHNFSTFVGRPGIYLEDIFIRPEYRGRGMGRALLAHIARIARARGCGRFEWWVLDWNRPAIGFYRKLGAVPMSDWTVFRLHGKALDRLAEEPSPNGRRRKAAV